ncbi:MAG TPA: ABC transporter ATP-binding protein [Thermoanaerobaculia bacterium]|nr:ABC transporter ATP-binding protein [Thermoanaerobaculia bacterium]
MGESIYLELASLDKRFGAQTVLSGLSLAIPRGEVFALLGPSGSGKTTALRLLAGFEQPDAGRIVVEGEDVTRLPPARRRFGMVFQHYALFPHLTVAANVAFGLSKGADRAERVTRALGLVDLAGLEDRPVTALSGGQQQRVALARALAPEPRVLLLDEPLSNLDPALRERTRRSLTETVRRVGITTVLVTHEQEEAFELGDRVGVLSRGRLEQVGTPEELYDRPASRFVATFVGRASILPGKLVRLGDLLAVELAQAARPGLVWTGADGDGALVDARAGAPVELILRPESLRLGDATSPTSLPGEVVTRRFAGAATFYTVALGDGLELEVAGAAGAAKIGDRVGVGPSGAGPVPRLFPRAELPA